MASVLRTQMMRRFKKTGTKPELAVRKLVARLGYRYQTYSAELPGNPDLVFLRKRKVIFVHGCFWHQHTGCSLARRPKRNQEYWNPKLLRNKQRDINHKRKLRQLGWSYLILWECEICKSDRISKAVANFLKNEHWIREKGSCLALAGAGGKTLASVLLNASRLV